jgi:hypothetical protein
MNYNTVMAWRRVSRADLDFLKMSAESSRNPHSDEETEQLALAAADAIKSLIAERKLLRQELAYLRQHVSLIRNGYQKLADDLIAQLRLFEGMERNRPGSNGVVEFPRLERDTQESP